MAVLADGQPVWPVPPGGVAAGQPQPFGVLSSGEYVWVQGSAQRRLYKKKRVLIPASLLGLFVFAGIAGGDTTTEDTTATAPAAAAAAAAEPAAASETAADTAADKAAADKAAADKAAADKAAADKAAADKAAADKAAAEAAQRGPQDQQAFVRAVADARQAWEDEDNELKQRQIQKQRSDALCSIVPSGSVSNWVGKVRDVSTNGEGKAVVELEIGKDVKASTWNNALSDFQDNTLIEMTSPMYETLVDVSEGDRVRFSGDLISDPEQCFGEQSLTFHGQMMTPNFTVRFSDVAPL